MHATRRRRAALVSGWRRGSREPLRAGEAARLTFLGAAGEVTGSSYLLETAQLRVLIDCGLFQGGRAQAVRNWSPFLFDPREIDAVLLTHAHIDHCGLLPRLCAEGFRGSIHATASTADVVRLMLADAAAIQEQDAARTNRKRGGRRGDGEPVEPLYTVEDARRACAQLVEHPFERRFEALRGLNLCFRYAGHILGAASLEIGLATPLGERRIVGSGDIGRYGAPLLRGPHTPEPGELVLMEATYGDRDHKDTAATLLEFERILASAAEARENVIVPVFALGRAQEVLFHLGELERAGRMRARPIFLDSPMAIDVSELYERHADCLDDATDAERRRLCWDFSSASVRYTRTPQESMQINQQRGAIVLSASGMCEAGRILHHLKHNLGRSGAQIVMAGFQAEGTLGRRLVEGQRVVRVLGEWIDVRAQVHTLGGFSAHADRSGLTRWLEPLAAARPLVVLVHAEREKRESFAAHVAQRFGLSCVRPERGQSLSLTHSGWALMAGDAPAPAALPGAR